MGSDTSTTPEKLFGSKKSSVCLLSLEASIMSRIFEDRWLACRRCLVFRWIQEGKREGKALKFLCSHVSDTSSVSETKKFTWHEKNLNQNIKKESNLIFLYCEPPETVN
jgi:hypothetical protein